jgi:hypothetical protein
LAVYNNHLDDHDDADIGVNEKENQQPKEHQE